MATPPYLEQGRTLRWGREAATVGEAVLGSGSTGVSRLGEVVEAASSPVIDRVLDSAAHWPCLYRGALGE